MSDASSDRLLEPFQAAIGAEAEINLLDCALQVAQLDYPLLNRASYAERVDAWASELSEAFAPDTLARLVQVKRLLFDRLGFHGNQEDYYDPRNSFMNEVIDRRTGIPISLCVVFIEVGRRLGLPMVGIGMPGHFLAGCSDQFDLFVDAFDNGKLLTRSDCVAIFRRLHPAEPFRPEYLAPVGARAILTRLLSNLVEIYVRASRPAKALPMLERMILLNPAEAELIRRRAAMNSAVRNYSAAARDLERYLALVPDAPDRDELARNLGLLHHLRGMVN